MVDFLLNIITLGLKPLYEKHLQYYLIVKEFREKLPRPQNQAREMTEEEKGKFLGNSGIGIRGLDLSTQKVSVSEGDLDLFYNKLNQFDYSFIIFKKYYRLYTRNLNRFQPKAENRNFDLAMIQLVLDTNYKPLKPIPVLIYHLKYEYKLTSKVYMWYVERTRNKR
jgi:hypothetical protein